LWKSAFGFDCPGCGLTTAFMHLLQLDAHGAFEANYLIFIILPAGLFFIIKDYLRYRKKHVFSHTS
tara:strand:- start:199 stop:396 length:198 start_codon:yes stop_codon:yes gene_type:complete